MSDSRSTNICPKCRSFYSDKPVNQKFRGLSRFPRILPGCSHNICEACLAGEGRKSGQVRCAVPGCAFVVPWSASELDSFPRDFYLMGSLTHQRQEEQLRLHDQSVDFRQPHQPREGGEYYMCGECYRRLAVWNCKQCSNNFCKECFNIVHCSKDMLRHQRSAVRERDQDNLALMISQFTDNGERVDLRSVEAPKENDSKNLDELILQGTNALLRLKAARESLLRDQTKPYDNIQRKIQAQVNSWHRQLQTLQHCIETQIKEIEKDEKDQVTQLSDSISSRIEEVTTLLRIANLAKNSESNFNTLKIMHLLKALQQESSTVARTPGILNVKINQQIEELLKSGLVLDKVKHFSVKLNPSSPRNSMEDVNSVPEKKISITSTSTSDVKCPPIVPYFESTSALNNCSKMTASSEAAKDGNRYYDRNSLLSLKDSTEALIPPNFKEIIPEVTGAFDKNLVIVCHVVNPGEFFVQFVRSEKKLVNVMKTVNALENGKPPDGDSLKVGDPVVARFSADQKLYRGSVLSIDKNAKFEIQFVDFGNSEEVNLSDLRMSTKFIHYPPSFAKKCALFGISPKASEKWSEASVDYFEELSTSPLLLTEVNQIGDTSYVELCSLEPLDMSSNSPPSVSDLLVTKNLAEFSSPPQKLVDLMDRSGYFSLDTLKEGETHRVFVSHIEDPSMLAVQLIGEHGTWATCVKSLVDEMQSAYGNRSSTGSWSTFTPQVGKPCAAVYSVDRKYYRALIVRQASASQFEVQFVDFGNCEVVDHTQIGELMEKFRKVPAMAVNVSLSDVQATGVTWTLESTRALKRLTQCKDLLMYVEASSVKGDPYQVYLYQTSREVDVCINAKLVNEGFAASKTGINLQVEYPKYEADLDKPRNIRKSRDNLIQKMMGKGSKKTNERSDDSVDNSSDQVQNEEGDRQCIVTHMVSPSRLYVRNLEDSERFSLFSFSLQANVSNNISRPHTMEPYHIGQTCVVLDDRTWERGIIVKIHPNTITVFEIDSGKVKEVSALPDNIRSLPCEFSENPPFCQPVHLTNIQPTGGTLKWSIKAREKLDSWLEDYDHIVTVKNDGEKFEDKATGLSSQPVELFIERVIDMGPLEPLNREQVSLSKKLVDRGLALPVRVQKGEICKKVFAFAENVGLDADVYKLVFANKSMAGSGDSNNEPVQSTGSFNWKKAPVVESKFIGTVTHVDNNGNIFVQPKQNQEAINTIRHILNSKYQDTKPKPHDLFWFPNQCCIAQFDLDKNWCRGKVLRQVGQNVLEVLFVDFGNTEKVEASKLRKNLFVQQLPEQCIQLKLGQVNITGSVKKVIGFLDELLVDKSVEVTITEKMPVVGNLQTMAGKDVAEHLMQCGYAVRKKNLSVITESEEDVPEFQSVDRKAKSTISKFEIDAENNKKKSEVTLQALSKCDENDSGHSMNDRQQRVTSIITLGSDEDTDYMSESSFDSTFEGAAFSFKEGEEFWAMYICHLSGDVICCRLIQNDENLHPTGFKTVSDELQVLGERQTILLKGPKKNEVVLARNILDGKWCRSVVMDPGTMKVLFVDYGNSAVVDEVRRLPDGLDAVPELALRLNIVGEINLQDVVSLRTKLHCRMVKLEENGRRSVVGSVEILHKMEFVNSQN